MLVAAAAAACESPPKAASPAAPAQTLPAASSQPGGRLTESITIRAESFELELAADEPSRTRGLMGRTEINPTGGMLFIFDDDADRSFWMANCVIDIDIAFVNSHGVVTASHEMKAERPRGEDEPLMQYEARLASYASRRPAQFAIELKAGSIRRLGLKAGQQIKADWKRIGKLAK